MASAAARLKYARALELLSAQESEQAAAEHASAKLASDKEKALAALEAKVAELSRSFEDAAVNNEARTRAEVAERLVAALTADLEAVRGATRVAWKAPFRIRFLTFTCSLQAKTTAAAATARADKLGACLRDLQDASDADRAAAEAEATRLRGALALAEKAAALAAEEAAKAEAEAARARDSAAQDGKDGAAECAALGKRLAHTLELLASEERARAAAEVCGGPHARRLNAGA